MAYFRFLAYFNKDSCSNYSAHENWRYASRRWSGIPENVEIVPDISGYDFYVFLCRVQKQYDVLHRPVPEIGRFPEDLVSLWLQLPENFSSILQRSLFLKKMKKVDGNEA